VLREIQVVYDTKNPSFLNIGELKEEISQEWQIRPSMF
jgi:hypothetical protein